MSAGQSGRRRPEKEASLEEVIRAIEGLGSRNILRLKMAADSLIQKLPDPARTGDDLYQEAIVRLCDRRRRWSKAVPFEQNFHWTMVSIVSDWGKKRRKLTALLLDHPLVARILGLREPSAQNQEEMSGPAAGRVRLLLAQFDRDEDATAILQGWSLGLKGPQIRAESGLSARRFNAARRRIARNVKTRDQLYHEFAKDPIVTAVLRCLEEGMSQEKTCGFTGISQEEYAAARRKIARRSEPAGSTE